MFGVVREKRINHILSGAFARETARATKVNDIGAGHIGISAIAGSVDDLFLSFRRFRFGGGFGRQGGVKDVGFNGLQFFLKKCDIDLKFLVNHFDMFFFDLIVIFTHSFLPYFFHLSHYLTHTFIHTHPFLLLFLFVL